MRQLAVIACAILTIGCARNAILELEVELASRGASDAVYAVVEASVDEHGDDPFSVQWDVDPLEPVALGDAPISVAASLVTETYRGDVLVRVRFCRSPDCRDLTAPRDPLAEVRFRVGQPFYIGARTRLTLPIPTVPDSGAAPPSGCAEVDAGQPTWACLIDRCEVRGCASGGDVSNYCVDDRHFCEGI